MLSEQQKKVCCCVPCPDEAGSALSSLTDLGLLSDPIFLLFAASNFLTSIGFYAPYIFIVDRALDIGIVAEKTPMLLAVVGISNTISRVVLGYVSDLAWVNRLLVYNTALTICGLATCFSIWMTSYEWQLFYAAMFGCTSGAYVGLTSVVLVDLLGMEKLTNAFGLVLMFQGLAAVIGPPMCGSLYESSQNYNYTFLLAGTMIALSGIMLFFTPCVLRLQERRRQEVVDSQSPPHGAV
ncbi:Major facilitator superfamily [Trinorchestia longiramus]|nr:Major facilitator superfamily [Trinorchestia longiramus]